MSNAVLPVSRDIGSGIEFHGRRETDFGLVVGIDHYPRFRSLRGAITDAIGFHTWLCDPDGGGVAAQHARLVVSTPDPLAPVQDEVDEKILELVQAADAIGGGRRLYFHFSGHGAGSPDESCEDVALLLAKWSWSLARIALSTAEYRGALGKMGLFEEIVVTLDCCRTMALRTSGLPPTITHLPRTRRCATRMFIAYATEAGASAFEAPDQGTWQGMFTRHLLAILHYAPYGISAANLKREIEYRVALNGQQAHVNNGLRDDSRFGRRGVLPKLEITFNEACGRVQLRDGSRAVIATRNVGPEPWELLLEPGLYLLEDEHGRFIPLDHGGEAVLRVTL